MIDYIATVLSRENDMNGHKIFEELQLVVLSFSHKVRHKDFLSCYERCIEDVRYSINFTGVIDLRDAELDFSIFEMKDLGNYIFKKHCQEGTWAILVDSPINTALSTVYAKAFSGKYEVKLFSSMHGISGYFGYSMHTALARVPHHTQDMSAA